MKIGDYRGNVLVLTYWSFRDALIQTYTLPYVRMIKKSISENGQVVLVTLEQKHLKVSKSEKQKIYKNLKDEGIVWRPFTYSKFGFGAGLSLMTMMFKLWWVIGQNNVNTIHAWCMPAGGIGWILSKITGVPLILDSYEPHAEPMVEAGEWDRDSLAFRILFWMEGAQSRHTDVAIACVDKMAEYAMTKYKASFENFFIKPAGVDFDLFHPRERKNKELLKKHGLEGKVVYVYAGKFGGSYLSDEVFQLLKAAQDHYGDKFGVVLLNSHSSQSIKKLAQLHGLSEEHIIHTFVPHKEVPRYMGLGDVGLVPFIPVPSKRFGSPIKTAEYLSMGMPIIITDNISDDSQFVNDNNLGYVLRELTYSEYQEAVGRLDILIKEPDFGHRSRSKIKTYRSFNQAQVIYKTIYSSD